MSILYVDNNNLTSFNGVGLSSIEELSLYSNQLTSFSAAGISSVLWLGLDDNRITSLNANILQTSLPHNNSAAALSLNCLDMESLPANIVDWLDEVSADDWTLRNS